MKDIFRLKDIFRRVALMTSRGALSLLTTLFIVGCGSERQPSESSIEVRVRTQLDQPIEGLWVRAGQRRSITDDQGMAEFSLPGDRAVTLEARCPPEMHGNGLRREFSPEILSAGARFSTELVCWGPPPVQTLAVFAEGCGEVEVFVDDLSVGVTENGWLHEEQIARAPRTAHLRVEPVEGTCEFKSGADRQVPFSASRPGAWVHLQGARPVRRPRSPGRKANVDAPRPYRL